MTSTIPFFPVFKTLEIGDHDELKLHCCAFPPYSDFNFVSLYCYDTAGDCGISILNDNLVVRLRDYVTLERCYSFIGRTRLLETIDTLLALCLSDGIPPALRLVPHTCINGNGSRLNGRVALQPDPSAYDYILDVNMLKALKGAALKGKRRAISNLRRAHSDIVVRQIDLEDAATQHAIRRLLRIWAAGRSQVKQDAGNEMKALDRLLTSCKHFQLVSFGAFVQDTLEGFTINELIPDNYYMAHFGKANHAFPGLSALLEMETAVFMEAFGCMYMNYQQDLGIPGLREHKLSWRPIAYLRKYIVTALC